MVQELGVLLSLGAALLWGFNAFFIRKGLSTSNPFAGALFSLIVASLIYLLVTAFTGFLYEEIPLSNLVFLASAGFVGYSLAYLFYFNSIELIGISKVATITSARPFIAAILALLIFREVMSFTLAAGTLFVVVGVALVSGDAKGQRSKGGEVLAISTALCWGLYPILVKEGLKGLTSVAKPTLITMVFATALYISLSLALRRSNLLLRVDRYSLGFFVLSGFASGFANLLFFIALAFTPVTIVMPLSNIYPFIALALGIFVLSEKVTSKVVIGAILIFLGVFLVII